MIEGAARDIAENMRDGALVILRSTVKVGTTRDVVSPILAASGKSSISRCARNAHWKARRFRNFANYRKLSEPTILLLPISAAPPLFRELTISIVLVSDIETAEIIKLVSKHVPRCPVRVRQRGGPRCATRSASVRTR